MPHRIGTGTWNAPATDGGDHDHAARRSRRSFGSTRRHRAGRRVDAVDIVTGLTQRTTYTVPGDRVQTAWHERRRPSERRSIAAVDDFRLHDPDHCRTPATGVGRDGRRVQRRHRRRVTGAGRFYKSAANTGTHTAPLVRDRRPGSPRPRSPTRIAKPAGSRSPSPTPSRCRGHDLHRVVLRSERALLRDDRGLGSAVENGCSTRVGHDLVQRRLRLRGHERVPLPEVQWHELLGRRDVRPGRPRPADWRRGQRGNRHVGQRVVERADHWRPAVVVQDHGLHGQPGAGDQDGRRARHQRHRHRAHHRDRLHLHSHGDQPDGQRPGVGGLEGRRPRS